jgi:hypothetical protein
MVLMRNFPSAETKKKLPDLPAECSAKRTISLWTKAVWKVLRPIDLTNDSLDIPESLLIYSKTKGQ